MTQRQQVIDMLEKNRLDEVVRLARQGHSVVRLLISLTYDRTSLLAWRAIEAVGLVAGDIGRSDPAAARNLAQRLLWMMREESGNNPWSVPDLLGEIVRNNPVELCDIALVITSFCDEEILKQGVMRAAVRLAEVMPDVIRERGTWLVDQFLGDNDPVVRAYAVMLAGRLGVKEALPGVERLKADEGAVMLYEGGELRPSGVGKIAEETAILLRD
jgi:hypothetical protein